MGRFLYPGDLLDVVPQLGLRKLLTLSIWLQMIRKPKVVKQWDTPSAERALVLQASVKSRYVIASEVYDGEEIHFVKDASEPFAKPIITPPRICQLCGKGFQNNKDLVTHARKEHAGLPEVFKRTLWEAQRLHALPLSMRRKRNMLANFDREYRCSRPGGDGELGPREDIACVVCACKDWSEERFYVRLWQKPKQQAEQEDEVAEQIACEEDAENSDESEIDAGNKKIGRLLRDRDGVYTVGDPGLITKFLSPDNYHAVMPCIPLEELHASSVQHPFLPDSRWLLHTRRVKCTEFQRPPGDTRPICAGVGDVHAASRICKSCRDALCTRTPTLPPLSLASMDIRMPALDK